MDKEHTIRNGASQIIGCAEHIRTTFSSQGYKVDTVKSNDADRNGLFVQICNFRGVMGGLAKTVTGLDVGAILKLWTDGEDLKFRIDGSKWMNPMILGSTSILMDPLPPTVGLGIFNPLLYAGLRNQKRLIEKVFMETMSFLTTQRS